MRGNRLLWGGYLWSSHLAACSSVKQTVLWWGSWHHKVPHFFWPLIWRPQPLISFLNWSVTLVSILNLSCTESLKFTAPSFVFTLVHVSQVHEELVLLYWCLLVLILRRLRGTPFPQKLERWDDPVHLLTYPTKDPCVYPLQWFKLPRLLFNDLKVSFL